MQILKYQKCSAGNKRSGREIQESLPGDNEMYTFTQFCSLKAQGQNQSVTTPFPHVTSAIQHSNKWTGEFTKLTNIELEVKPRPMTPLQPLGQKDRLCCGPKVSVPEGGTWQLSQTIMSGCWCFWDTEKTPQAKGSNC